MKKKFQFIIFLTFMMLMLLPGGAALAVTFGFDTGIDTETDKNNTISDVNGSGYILQISSSDPNDLVSNMDCLVGLGNWLDHQANPELVKDYLVCIGDFNDAEDGDGKPNGTITVKLSSGKAFSLKSFVCANESYVPDTLTISNGIHAEATSLPIQTNTLIVASDYFIGITSFTMSWVSDGHMNFDNFIIEPLTAPVIKTQPSSVSVASGDPTAFSVAAVGNGTLSYQWQMDSTGTGDSFISYNDNGVYHGFKTAALNLDYAVPEMNNYLFRCIVTDGDGKSSASNPAKLTVLAQAPTDISLDHGSIPENSTSGTTVGTLTSTDPDTASQSSFTYSLVDTTSYPDNNSFIISGNNLLLNMVPDHETQSSYTICVQTRDDMGLTYKKAFTVTITDVNDKPTNITLSKDTVLENSTPGTEIGKLTGTDPDEGAILTYSLPEGLVNNASFTLSGNSLQLSMVPNYEGTKTYKVVVRVSDGVAEDSYYDKEFTINILNVNERPTGISLDHTNVLEHCPTGTDVGTISAVDPDAGASFTFQLASGEGDTDNSCFKIVYGKLQLNSELDYETKAPDYAYNIRIRVTDEGSLSYEQEFTITVLDGNDPPTDITLTGGSIAENSAPGSSVGSLASIDNAGDSFTYTLVEGVGATDNADFTLTGNVLFINTYANYEGKKSYSVRIRSMDNHGLYFEKALTISITNVNEAPIDMAITNNTIAENSAIGTTIGTLTGTDPDAGATLAFTLVPASLDNDSFTILGSSLKLALKPDFETKDTYSVIVRESDGELTFDKIFIIHITDAEDAPTDISLTSSSVLEHCAVGTTVGNFDSDDEDADQLPDDFDYSLVAGEGAADNACFTISADTLQISVSPDFEVKNAYSIRVRTVDKDGLYYDEILTITILDGDDPPTDISLSKSSITENSPVGTVIGSLSSTDNSGAGPFTYTFASGSGDTDNACFFIDDSALKLAVSPNYEVKNIYSIRIRTTNNTTGFYFEKAFTITITDVNEAPTFLNLSGFNITEHIASGTTVATILGFDPDAGATFTYTLATGFGDVDNASFTISGNELKLAVVPDYEIKPIYEIRIRVTDNGSLTLENSFVLEVINGNDPPDDLYMTSSSIQENIPPGTIFTSFGCLDLNGGAMTYSLVEGLGSTDNDNFTFFGNALSMKEVPDYETKDNYHIRVRVTDSGGLYYEEAFTITVVDMPEAPTALQLTGTVIAENRPIGTNVGTLSGTDQDALHTLTYSFATGTGDTDNAYFTIFENTLKANSRFDYEAKSSYSIRIRVTDSTALWYEKQFTISVGDINDAPTDISLSNNSIAENSSIQTSIGTFSGTDQDAGSTFTYSLVTGAGDTSNSSFTISGNTLKLAVVPDYETKSSYDIRVRVADNGSLTFEKPFIVTITDGNDAPSDIILSADKIDENSALDTIVATISSTDIDSSSFTYSLIPGTGSTDNVCFTISGNELKLAVVPDYEVKTKYNIRIRSTDDTALSYEKAFVIFINNLNDTPIITPPTPSQNPISEKITLDVTNGSTDDSVAKIEVERTTQADGTVTDSVTFGEVKTKETIEKLEEEDAETVRINIPMAEKTSEIEVNISTGSLEMLSDTDLSLELETEAARISIPNSALETASDELEEDLFFRVNPVTDEEEQEKLSERASKNGMLVQMLGEDLSVIGTPMEIETNMPQTPIDILLPLNGIAVPEGEKARTEFLSKLAIYVEHSDGEKEVIRGEIVEYSEGVYGLKFSVSKFSTFTIIKEERTKSNQCSILSVKSPAGTSLSGTMLKTKVRYNTSSAKIKITVSEGATWKIYSDKACTKEINTKVKLKSILTKVYLKVSAEDGVSYKIYTLYIIRSKTVTVNK